MSFLNPCHRGLAYGDGYMQGAGTTGQIVRLIGNDLFTVNTSANQRSFGVLIGNYVNGEMPGVFCNGGVYETDVFEGTIGAGDVLKCSSNGILTNGVAGNDLVIAQAISVQGGILKFQLLV